MNTKHYVVDVDIYIDDDVNVTQGDELELVLEEINDCLINIRLNGTKVYFRGFRDISTH